MIDNRPVPNPIPKFDLFASLSIEEVFEYIQTLSGQERNMATKVAMLMLNACHEAVEEEVLSKEIFA